MSGTKAGAAKAKMTRLKEYGVDANGKSIQHQLAGKKGGAAERTDLRGFAANPKLASIAGKKGGAIGRKKTPK